MRFSTLAFMAGSALAQNSAESSPVSTSTDYTTHLVTITACPGSVTNCPVRSMTSAVVTSVLPLTTSTVYSTRIHTVISCGPTVTNCPAHSTVKVTETVPVSTTVCPVVPTSPVPVAPSSHYGNVTIVVPSSGSCGGSPCPPGSGNVVPSGPANTVTVPPSEETESPETEAPETESPETECVGSSVTAITKSYTTVLTSVEYSTVAVACPTGQPQGPSGTVSLPTATPTAVTPPAVTSPPQGGNGNGTQPGGNRPPVTAGASSLAGSALVAAVAGVAAAFVLV